MKRNKLREDNELISLLVDTPPLAVCEGSKHQSQVDEIPPPVLLEEPWLQHVVYFEFAVRRHPSFRRRIKVHSTHNSGRKPIRNCSRPNTSPSADIEDVLRIFTYWTAE